MKLFNKKKKKENNSILGFVLLNSNKWLKKDLINNVNKDWNIKLLDTSSGDEPILTMIDGMKVVIGYMDYKIPDNEAESFAKFNHLWKDAEKTVSTQEAHIIISILNYEDVKKANELFVKIASSCLKLDNAIALYFNETIYEPKFYIDCSKDIKNGLFPILNLVWFGLYINGEKKGFYTFGLQRFGYKELEIYTKSNISLSEIQNLIISIAEYVINGNVTLKNGETIGFTAQQKFKITESKAIALDGTTLKVDIG